eukprot:360879-Chlamydomonas_euryale.AAC.1
MQTHPTVSPHSSKTHIHPHTLHTYLDILPATCAEAGAAWQQQHGHDESAHAVAPAAAYTSDGNTKWHFSFGQRLEGLGGQGLVCASIPPFGLLPHPAPHPRSPQARRAQIDSELVRCKDANSFDTMNCSRLTTSQPDTLAPLPTHPSHARRAQIDSELVRFRGSDDFGAMNCPRLVARQPDNNGLETPELSQQQSLSWLMDPQYYLYEGCACDAVSGAPPCCCPGLQSLFYAWRRASLRVRAVCAMFWVEPRHASWCVAAAVLEPRGVPRPGGGGEEGGGVRDITGVPPLPPPRFCRVLMMR